MAGYSLDKNSLDQRLGKAAVGIVAVLAEWQDLFAMLADTDILGLPAGQNPVDPLTGLGYTAAEIGFIRSGAGDVGGPVGSLLQVAYNNATVPVPNNFLFHIKRLTGAQMVGGIL